MEETNTPIAALVVATNDQFEEEFSPLLNSLGYPTEFVTKEFCVARTNIRLGSFRDRKVVFKMSRCLFEEIEVHSQVGHHPRVVSFIGEIDMRSASTAHRAFLMEMFGTGLTLDKYLYRLIKTSSSEPLPIPVCLRLIEQIAEGLTYLHSKKIIHHDLKTENILLEITNDVIDVKISDFGVSEITDEKGYGDPKNRQSGTVGWLAPEQSADSIEPITTKLDVYNFGHICYRILFTQRPFQRSLLELPDGLEKLVRICFDNDQEKRPTMIEFMSQFKELDMTKNELRLLKESYETAVSLKIDIPIELTKVYDRLIQLLEEAKH